MAGRSTWPSRPSRELFLSADDLPYWDAVAALNTPTECWGPESAHRRDRFLRAAIAHL